jgi:hypothetical protein
MTTTSGVTERAASLLRADPTLAPLLGGPDAAGVGRRLLLPVLNIPAGPWEPPDAEVLDGGTIGLTVLSGALLRERNGAGSRLFGPGDLIEPWSEPRGRWTACSPAEVALIGRAFRTATDPWPLAARHMLRRAADAREGIAVGLKRERAGAPEERLAGLLWRLAARWGRADGDGVMLPLALRPALLALLAALPEPRAADALRALGRAGTVARRADGTWLLHAGGRRLTDEARGMRRDALRERFVRELVSARATAELSAQLIEDAAAQMSRRGER